MIDARLVLPAGAAWAGAAAAQWWLGEQPTLRDRHAAALAVLLLALALLVALAVAVAAWRAASGRGGRRAGGRDLVVGLAVVFLAVGALSAGVRTATWTVAPLAGWTDSRATAVVHGVVVGEPVPRQSPARVGWESSAWLEVSLAAEQVAARGSRLQLGVPIVVRLPGGTRAPPPGALIEVTGRLGPASPRAVAAAALDATAGRTPVPGAAAWRLLEEPGFADRAAQAMRAGLRTAVQETPAEAGALVAGLAVGDESAAPATLTADMRASGLSHLTAVSGGNVAIVLGVVLALAIAIRLRLALRVLTALVALGYFVLLVGPEPSVLRAAVMGAVTVGALLVGGRRAGPSLLAVGVLVLLAAQPPLALSWAFALSVCATGGLILLAPRLAAALAGRRWTGRWPPAIRLALAITVAAQVATLPVLVAMGGASGWVAVPANLLAMPVVAPVTVLGLLAALLSPVLPGAAAVAAHVAAWPAGWIATVAHACADLPAAGLPLPAGWAGVGWLVLGAGVLALLRLAWPRLPRGVTGPRSRWALAAVVTTALVLTALLPPDRRGWPPAGWFLIMCDVGQGDALLLRADEGAAVVVDAGPDPERIDGCLADAGIEAVPALILTHFHADHVRGVSGVLEDRSVAAVLATPVRDPGVEAEAVDRALIAHGLAAEAVTAGDRWRVGDVDLLALWPRRRIDAGSVPNNASIVLQATVGGRSVLLTGDIEPEAQAAVAADLVGRRFDVVKVPHHGSRYQSRMLTTWARAPVALVSVGADNDYGHPAAQTLDAWLSLGALVARTDRDGDIAVIARDGALGVVTRAGNLPRRSLVGGYGGWHEARCRSGGGPRRVRGTAGRRAGRARRRRPDARQ